MFKQVPRTKLFVLCSLLGVSSCRTFTDVNLGPSRDDGDGYGSGAEVQNLPVRPSNGQCAGFPRAQIETMPNTCLGIVAQKTGAFRPRIILPIPGRSNEYLVTDTAGFSDTNSKIWHLKDTGTLEGNQFKLFLGGLSLVHQLQVLPASLSGNGEDWVLFGETNQIQGFPVSAISANGTLDASKIKPLITGLPPFKISGRTNSLHPVSHFVIDDSGNIIVNVGAFSDHCVGNKGARCLESSLDVSSGNGGADPQNAGAVLRKYQYAGSVSEGWNRNFTVVAQGLRNSMGLLFTKSGDLIQVENARDFPESQRPYEELNVIPQQALQANGPTLHYGWPYCYDVKKPAMVGSLSQGSTAQSQENKTLRILVLSTKLHTTFCLLTEPLLEFLNTQAQKFRHSMANCLLHCMDTGLQGTASSHSI